MAPLRTAEFPVRVDGEAQSLERTLRIVAPAACPQPANKLGKLGILLRQLEKIAYLESRRVGIEEVTKPDNPHTKLGNLLVLMPHHGLQIVMKLQRNFLNARQKVAHALRKVDAKHEVDLIRHEKGSPFFYQENLACGLFRCTNQCDGAVTKNRKPLPQGADGCWRPKAVPVPNR